MVFIKIFEDIFKVKMLQQIILVSFKFYQHTLQIQQFRFMKREVYIHSDYIGCVWAAKMLRDWGISVKLDQPTSSTELIIADQNTQSSVAKYKIPKIILKDTKMSSAHVLALSGCLSTFGQKKQPFFPRFVVETVVANCLAIQTMQILYSNALTQNFESKTQYISIVLFVKYFGAFNISAKENDMINHPRGQNILEGGAPFYSVYKCKQGYFAVGNLQPKFYSEMIRGLILSKQERAFCEDSQFSSSDWSQLRSLLTSKFMEKTATDWEIHFMNYDTCITSIKTPFQSSIREPKLIDLKPNL